MKSLIYRYFTFFLFKFHQHMTLFILLSVVYLFFSCGSDAKKTTYSDKQISAGAESIAVSQNKESHLEKVHSADVSGTTSSSEAGEAGISTTGKEVKTSRETTKRSESKQMAAVTSTAALNQSENQNLVFGINLGYMDIVFKPGGKSVVLLPEAARALKQVRQDGFSHLRLMEPFARGFMPDFPSLPVQAIKLLKEQGFKILISINGSPFINGSDRDKWIYRYFPGKDATGKDDDGGIQEHRLRMKKFMDALKSEGLLPYLQFELFNEPNAEHYFWGTFMEFEQLLAVNKEIILDPAYGIQEENVLCCAFTSNLVQGPRKMKTGQQPYWDFVNKYNTNTMVRKMPFSFHWYPSDGLAKETYQTSSVHIKPTNLLKGAWITEMNVTSVMKVKHLLGDGKQPGYRARNSFKEKTGDIIEFAKRNKIAGIYFFNLKNKSDQPNEKGKIGLGLFNAAGCPRKEYKDLLELLNKPVHFGGCPDPKPTDI